MLTLTYGYKKPQTGDRGASLFTALEGNIQQLNDHTHNGTNSAKLAGSAVDGDLKQALAAGWIADVDGMFYQTVTLSAGYDFDKQQIVTKLTSTKEYVFPKIERVAANQLKIWTNDNTVSFDILVGG